MQTNPPIISHINDLPPDIMAEIFSQLELTQLNNFKFVCRYWNAIISNPAIWEKSFSQKFKVNDVFPSFSNRSSWTTEYLARIKNLKKWKKGEATHMSYQVLNEIYLGDNEFILCHFESDRLLTYSRINNNVTICQLHSGRNQTFIPGNIQSIKLYALNWNYLVFSTTTGGLYIKNLFTSTTGSTRSSTKEIINGEEVFEFIKLNPQFDKYQRKVDIIVTGNLGNVYFYNIKGDLIYRMAIHDKILDITSDFTEVIVVSVGKIYIVDILDFKFRTIDIDTRGQLDYDMVDNNIIIRLGKTVTVLHYKQETKITQIELNNIIKYGKVQTNNKPKRDLSLIGKDGLFYAVVLNNNQIVVISIRGEVRVITKFYTLFKYKNLSSLVGNSHEVMLVALNSSVIVAGGYNGFCNVHDLFTGQYIRECSAKYPKKYSHMFQYKLPVRDIQLNQDMFKADGIIACGDIIQYFCMGRNEGDIKPKNKASVIENNSQGKKNVQKIIKDQLEDYDTEKFKKKQLQQMFSKYNGDDYDSEDELSIALALSESTVPAVAVHDTEDTEEMEDIRRVLAMSTLPSEEDEVMKRVLELSLTDH